MDIANLNPIEAIQHWLITPLGAYYGYPNYGNKIDKLLYHNRQDLHHASSLIIKDITEDLGRDYAKQIASIEILADRENFYIVVALKNKEYAVGVFNV